MKKIIISDTTALIILSKTNHLELLTNLIDKVYIPNAVMEEISYKNDKVKYLIKNSSFIEVKKITNQDILKEVESNNLDRGETEAISLALEEDYQLLIDERLGRKYAESRRHFISSFTIYNNPRISKAYSSRMKNSKAIRKLLILSLSSHHS